MMASKGVKMLLVYLTIFHWFFIFPLEHRTVYADTNQILRRQVAEQGGAKSLPELSDYSARIQALQKAPDRQPIEAIYRLGSSAGQKLLPILENLSEAEFQQVSNQMVGFHISRNEVTSVVPNIPFFKDLSQRKGIDPDIAFFDLLSQTRRDGWPVYVQPTTDFQGCTKYGEGLLVELYGKWQNFRITYPSAYKAEVKEMMDDITNRLILKTPSCGPSSETITELKLFLQKYPGSEYAESVRRRLIEISSDHPG